MLLRSCCCWHLFWSWCFYVGGVSSVVASYCYWLFFCCSGQSFLLLLLLAPMGEVGVPSNFSVTSDVDVPAVTYFFAFMLLCGILQLTPMASLPPLPSPLAMCHRYQRHQWSMKTSAKMWSPVSLIPVVHLDLRKSPRIFEKIRNDPNFIIRGMGEDDLWKTWSKKSRDTLPLSFLL